MKTETSVATNTIPHSLEVGVRLVLNGGNPTMERATIPIQWFFSKEVASRRPTHILIIEQDGGEMTHGPREGARYLYKVTDLVGVIQVFSPGCHRVIVLALNDTDGPNYLKEYSRRRYDKNVYPEDVVRAAERFKYGQSDSFSPIGEDVVGAAIQEVDVPEELFARKPGGPFKDGIWKWTNRWFKNPPRDECRYRGRLIWALTAQPLLFTIGMILRWGVALLSTVALPPLRLLVLFLGFRPAPFFTGIADIWKWDYDPRDEDVLFQYPRGQYRAWEWHYHRGTTKGMPITGIEIAAMVSLVWGVVRLYRWDAEVFYDIVIYLTCLMITISMVLAVVMAWSIFMEWLQGHVDEVKERRQQRAVELRTTPAMDLPSDNYTRWLTLNLATDKAPAKVDFKNLPPAYKLGVVQKFRVAFWDAKMKVCRPFAR